MTDDDRVGVTAECLVQCHGVDAEHARLVPTVGRNAGGCVAALERCDRPVPGGGKGGQQVAPSVSTVGEAVQAERQWAVAAREMGEIDPVGGDGAE